MNSRLLRYFLAASLVLTAACVSRLEAADLDGRWSGYWVDCNSGHSGPLRASFCKCGVDTYRVTFTGRFYGVIPFCYNVTLAVTGKDGEKDILSGESRVGLLFGTFAYRAEATDTDFVADFSSCRYQGKFVLKRCCP